MKKILLLIGAVAMLMPAEAEKISELTDSSRVYDLDEVVVVAQTKDYYTLRQQPMSATVLASKDMEQLGVRDLRDVSNYVPSFVMPAYGSRYTSSMYVRGIGSRINSPSLGIYLTISR